MKTHRVLNSLNKCANVRYRKKQVLLWFTINSQSKLKRFSISTKKSSLRNLTRFHGGFFWIGDPRKFHMSFFVKNYYLDLNFFQTSRMLFLKTKKKSSQKRCKSPKNCLTVDITRDRSKTLKKEKKQRKMKKSQTTAFYFYSFI